MARDEAAQGRAPKNSETWRDWHENEKGSMGNDKRREKKMMSTGRQRMNKEGEGKKGAKWGC